MEKFMEKISAFVEPLANWVSKQKFLNALAEAMQALLPITVIGSFACLFAFIDIGGWQAFLTANPILGTTFMNAHGLTLSCIAFYTCLVLPYLYAKRLNMSEPLATIPVTVAVFLLLTPTELYTSVPTAWLGHKGMFSVFLISAGVVRFIKLCQDKNITIKMPAGVPHYIEATFAVLIPAAILIFGASLIGQLMTLTTAGSIHQVIYDFIQAPLSNVGTSFLGLLVTEIVMTLAMFCGIHGSSVVPFMDALAIAAGEENAAAIAAGQSIPNIYCYGLLNSIQMGGIGATLGLGILLFFLAKSKRYKQLSRVAIVPQIFNIGEPLLFGIPIMLNPLLFIPYMGGVIANTCLAYFAVWSGLCARFTGVNPSWTVPGILQGLLTNSVPWQGALLQIVIIIMDMAIWYPFVRILDKQELEAESKTEQEAAVKA